MVTGDSDAQTSMNPVGEWSSRIARWLLCAAVVATPLLVDAVWRGSSASRLLYSPSSLLKACALLALVGSASIAFAVAVFAGGARVRRHWTQWLAVAVAGWAVVSAVAGVSPASAIRGLAARGEGLLTTIACALALVLVVQVFDTPRRLRALLRCVVASATLAAVYAVVQFLGYDPLEWGQLMWSYRRVFATMGNPDMFGSFMVLALFASLGLALDESRTGWRYALLGCCVLLATVLFMTFTRAAWLGAVVGAVSFGVLAWRARLHVGRTEIAFAVATAVLIGVAVAVAASGTGSSQVMERVSGQATTQDRNASARLIVWGDSLKAIKAHPIAGAGPGLFNLAFEPVKSARWAALVDPDTAMESAHDFVIEVAVEQGVVGLALLVALLACTAVLSLRCITAHPGPLRSPLVGLWSACAGYIAAWLLTPSAVPSSLYLWVFLGALLSPLAVRDRDTGRGAEMVGAGVIAMIGLAFVLASPVALIADRAALMASSQSLDPVTRLTAAERAVRTDPLVAEYRVVAAKAYADDAIASRQAGADSSAMAGSIERSLGHAREAVRLEPTNTRTRVLLASLLLFAHRQGVAGSLDEAGDLLSSARDASPHDLATRYWFAKWLIAMNRPARAKDELRAVLKVRPDYVRAAIELSGLEAASGNTDEAIATLESALKAGPNADIEAALQQIRAQ